MANAIIASQRHARIPGFCLSFVGLPARVVLIIVRIRRRYFMSRIRALCFAAIRMPSRLSQLALPDSTSTSAPSGHLMLPPLPGAPPLIRFRSLSAAYTFDYAMLAAPRGASNDDLSEFCFGGEFDFISPLSRAEPATNIESARSPRVTRDIPVVAMRLRQLNARRALFPLAARASRQRTPFYASACLSPAISAAIGTTLITADEGRAMHQLAI